MARGRKAAADSLEQELADARAPDLSTLPPPDVDGVECLDDVGRRFYAETYRTDPSRFTTGDLSMLVEAAHTFQLMTSNRRVLRMGQPLVVTLNNGMMARNPLYTAQQELTRQFQTLMRDLGVRSKDGFRAAVKSNAPTAKPTASGNVTSFEDFLNGHD